MMLPAILAGLATGMVLGLFGSGGSIIALPALLYLLHVEPKSAIAMSLGVVAVTATITALHNWRKGLVDVRIAAVFGLFGVAGTFAGARLGLLTPVTIQLGLFALVMYAAAWRMLKPVKLAAPAAGGVVIAGGGTAALAYCGETCAPKKCAGPSQALLGPSGGTERSEVSGETGNRAGPSQALLGPSGGTERSEVSGEANLGHIALHGIGVGVLTGLVGVGGGFLIVPALVLLSGIPMKTAVGTSLAIVAAKSYAGFAGYMGGVPVDYAVMGGFTVVTVIGSFLGAHFSDRLSQAMLKKAFAWFLVVVATYILFKSVL
jgi:uncharacterized membrane protein YfcA